MTKQFFGHFIPKAFEYFIPKIMLYKAYRLLQSFTILLIHASEKTAVLQSQWRFYHHKKTPYWLTDSQKILTCVLFMQAMYVNQLPYTSFSIKMTVYNSWYILYKVQFNEIWNIKISIKSCTSINISCFIGNLSVWT